MYKLGHDLTQGSIPRHLLNVALPMLLGNLINTGYSIVNAIWIGKIIGKEAMGAVAVSFPVIFIFVAVAAGATMATTILVSQYYGAKNFEKVQQTVGTSFTLALILGIVLSTAGIIFTDAILKIMGTPQDVATLAGPYLKISFASFTIMYFSFLITSILRGVGDTKTPLLFMVIGVIVNAILDPILIIGITPFPKMGLNGAAVASLISSFVAVVLGFWYLNNRDHLVRFNLKYFNLNKEMVGVIFKVGFPSMLQQSAIALGMATMVAFVNSFGESAVAAFGAAGRIDSVAFIPGMSIGMAVSAIAGQNIGAHKMDRVHQTFIWGVIMTSLISVTLATIFFIFPSQLLHMFLNDADVIHIGVMYLRIIGPALVFAAIMFVSNGVINGAGHTLTTLVFTILALWGVRVPMAAILMHTKLGINGIWISFAIGFFAVMVLSIYWYFSGKWKKMVINAEKRG